MRTILILASLAASSPVLAETIALQCGDVFDAKSAKLVGARTIVIACTPIDEELAARCDAAIVAITGPEVVTGSTRLKAGTATKMILNMLTTGAMIRWGKVWGNLMVDLQATNLKLRDRSERILVEVCDISRNEARALLTAAGGRVKTAIVMRKPLP